MQTLPYLTYIREEGLIVGGGGGVQIKIVLTCTKQTGLHDI